MSHPEPTFELPSPSDQPQHDEALDAPAPRKNRAPLFVAAGVVLALLVGVGAWAGLKLFSPASQPASRMPASLIAYTSVDLDPSLGQTVKLLNLIKKFPKLKDSATDPDKLLEKLLGDIKSKDFDIKQDVLSWAGDQIAVGFWLDAKSQPFALIGVDSDDDAKANAGLQKLAASSKGEMGFVVKDGFALIAGGEDGAQAAAEEAAKQAAERTLADEAGFSDLRDKLEDDQLIVAWADLDKVSDAMKKFMPMGTRGRDPKDSLPAYQGKVIVGVRATEDGLEATSRAVGMKASEQKVTDALKQLGELPAASQIAAVGSVPQEIGALGSLGGMFGLGMFGSGVDIDDVVGVVPGEPTRPTTPKKLTEAEKAELAKLLAKENPTDAERKRMRELMGFGIMPKMPPSRDTPAKQPDFLEALAGAVFSISVLKVDGDAPVAQIIATLKDAQAVEKLGDLEKESKGKVKVTKSGSTVTVVTEGYQAGGAKLSEQDAFRTATAGAPAQTETALFANLAELIPASARDELGPLKTLAVVQGRDGAELVAVVRLTIG